MQDESRDTLAEPERSAEELTGAAGDAGPETTLLAGRYRLEGLLGRGGMGSVYAAHDLELGEKVALKLLRVDTTEATAADELRAEVRIARKVTHANVARTYDLGQHDGRRFLTMELVDGPSLRGLLRSTDIGRAQRLGLIEQIAAGLAAVHEQNVLHRDLKPENVLVTQKGVAKITDFGIALVVDATPTDSAGTPGYMAPELLRGGAPSFASDVFSLGRVAYEVLAEAAPGGPPPGPDELLALEPRIRALVTRALDDDPTRRPTASDVHRALADLQSEEAPVTVSIASVRRRQKALRIGVAAFDASAAADAYLGTSLAADVMRALVEVPELEVKNLLLPATGALEKARDAGLRAMVIGSVRHTGEELAVTLRLVAVEDALQIWGRNFTATFDRVLAELADAASALARALDAHERPVAPTLRADARVVELYLRASEAEQRPWRDWESDAADFFTQALEGAPHDPVLLSGLALSLFRGSPPYDRERYLRGRDAVDRALLRGTRSASAQLACGVAFFLANEGAGAVEALRRALSLAPSLADAHSLLGAMAGDVGLLDEAIARSRLTTALDPRVAVARFVGARALEMKGDRAACDGMLAEGLAGPPTFGQYLCALSVTRFALWRATPDAHASALARLVPLAGHPLVRPLIDALEDHSKLEDVIGAIAPLRLASTEWARHRALALQLEAELLLAAGAHERAIVVIARLPETGSFDSAWFATCPLLATIADASPVKASRRVADERAVRVKEAIWSLSAGPRT